MNYVSFAALGNFLLYITVSCAMLALFTRLYIWFTPYNEMEQMRAGMKAPVIALVGAMFGFTLPLLTMSYVGARYQTSPGVTNSDIPSALSKVVFPHRRPLTSTRYRAWES